MENQLTVDTPLMTIFASPVLVMDPTDPLALPVGTIDPLLAQTIVDETPSPAPTGAMTNVSSPFNLLVGATIILGKNAPVPTGKLTVMVTVNAHAHTL